MWWEALPSFVIIVTCIMAPQVFNYTTNKLFLGTPYQRKVLTDHEAYCFLRDERISGKMNAYKQIGLSEADLGDEVQEVKETVESEAKVC